MKSRVARRLFRRAAAPSFSVCTKTSVARWLAAGPLVAAVMVAPEASAQIAPTQAPTTPPTTPQAPAPAAATAQEPTVVQTQVQGNAEATGQANGPTTGQATTGAVAPLTPGVAPVQPPALSAGPAPTDAKPVNPDDALVTGSAGARAAGLAPPGTNTGNFMDTRLTWTFGDDDVLNRTGQLVPLSPNFSVNDRPQYRLFFDNLNSRFAGRENLTHLVLYKKLPGYLPNLTTEAAVVLRFDFAALASNSGNLNAAFYDSGSYIRLFYKTGSRVDEKGATRDSGLSAVFFPLDTDRFRLGYLYDISWGGTDARINESIFPRLQGSSPGLKVQFDMPDRFYAFAGFKTATIVQTEQVLRAGTGNDTDTVSVGETNYGLLGGAGYDPTSFLHLDVGGGFFQQGKFQIEQVRGKNVYTYGGSARVVYHHKMPVPQSVDFRLYRNDPLAPMVLFAPRVYDPNELAWAIAGEFTALGQHLANGNKTEDQPAFAGALTGTLAAGYLRASVAGIARTLTYVVKNVPGVIPFNVLPEGAGTEPEIFGAATASYYLPGPRLTPEIGAGVQMPASFYSKYTEGGLPAQRVTVFRRQGDEAVLPFNEDRKPVVQARLSLTWNVSDFLSAVAWGQYIYDNNATQIVRDPSSGLASLRVFQNPSRLGFGLSLQARF